MLHSNQNWRSVMSKPSKRGVHLNKPRNFVAKAMHRIKKCSVHKDKKNDYQRRPKHQKNRGDFFGLNFF